MNDNLAYAGTLTSGSGSSVMVGKDGELMNVRIETEHEICDISLMIAMRVDS